MKCVWLDHGCVRLVQVPADVNRVSHYAVELEGEGALYSHTSYDAAEHYFRMLTQPLDQTAA